MAHSLCQQYTANSLLKHRDGFNGFPLVTETESFLTCFTHEAPWQLCKSLHIQEQHKKLKSGRLRLALETGLTATGKCLTWDPQAPTELERVASFSLSKEQQRAPQPFAPQSKEQNHRMVEAGTSGLCVISLLKAGSSLTGYLGFFPFQSGFEHLQVQGDSRSPCVC